MLLVIIWILLVITYLNVYFFSLLREIYSLSSS